MHTIPALAGSQDSFELRIQRAEWSTITLGTVMPALAGAHDALVRVNTSQPSSLPPHPLIVSIVQMQKPTMAQPGRGAPGLCAPKARTRGCNMNHCAAESPGTSQGVIAVTVSRQTVAGMCTHPCSCHPSCQLIRQLWSLGLDATSSVAPLS